MTEWEYGIAELPMPERYPDYKMGKWEQDLLDALTKLGNKGWELTAVLAGRGVLRRPKGGQDEH